MAVMTGDTRFEEVYREEGSGTNMCEYLDKLEARGEARGISIGEARGLAIGIRGNIATCRRLGLTDDRILREIMEQFKLGEKEAKAYLRQDIV